MNKRFTITTPIYYATAKPHVGHAFATIYADILARHHRGKGEDVFFLVGTDEHGAKVAQKADEAGKTPQEYVDEIAEVYRSVWSALNIEYSKFVRTTSPEHKASVRAFTEKLKDHGDIYEGEYEGLYCVECEDFITEKELVDGKCPDHKKEPQAIKEKNYFFALKKYVGEVRKRIKSDELRVEPETRRNETLKFLEAGLPDFSVSREKVKWGIPFPGDERQVIYVWVEALMNYVTALGFPDGADFKKYWPADVHVIGAEINKFHTVFWPAMLIAAGVPVPKSVFIHGLFTVNGDKMSKTVGNVIDPADMVAQFGADATRYLLVSQFPASEHGDIRASEFVKKYNTDLAGGVGNIFERIYALAIQNHTALDGDPDKDMLKELKIHVAASDAYMEKYKIYETLSAAFAAMRAVDQYVNHTEPWTLAKNGDTEELKTVLATLLAAAKELIAVFRPVLPDAMARAEEWHKRVLAGTADGHLALFPRIASRRVVH
ncbi:MAG: methionine--tRNA ligase [Candidatus Liptonbacteria bacterium]|nr:methionine--tRNA ligase [Candidatus Liptonbacteria bacterium]